MPAAQQLERESGRGLCSCAKRQRTGNKFYVINCAGFTTQRHRPKKIVCCSKTLSLFSNCPPSGLSICLGALKTATLRRRGLGVLVHLRPTTSQQIFSAMPVLKRGSQTSAPPKGYLQPIIKVAITTVFVLSLSYFTGDQSRTDQKLLTDTNNGQTRSISLSQTGEKNA
jgi:hypothetical protein